MFLLVYVMLHAFPHLKSQVWLFIPSDSHLQHGCSHSSLCVCWLSCWSKMVWTKVWCSDLMSVLPMQDLTVNLNVCQVVQRMTQFEKRQMETLVGITLAEMFWIQRHLVTNHHLLIMVFNPSRDTGSALFMFLKSICSVFISPEHLVTYHQALRAN